MGAPQQILAALGGGCTIPDLTQGNIVDNVFDPLDTQVDFRCDADGFFYDQKGIGAGFVQRSGWIGSCDNTEYEVRLVVNSGDNPTGSALNTWLATSSDRTWTLTQTVVGTKVANVTASIRRTSDDTLIKTVTFAMTANVNA